MKLTIAFKHLEHTPSLDERIREKTQKLEKYLEGNIHVKWTCYSNEGQQYSEIDLIGAHMEFHAKAKADTLYKTIDMVVDKVERQLIKKKQKWKNHIHKEHRPLVLLDPESAWADYDEDYVEEEAA